MMIEGLETERRRISRELHDTILPKVKDIDISDHIRSICVNLMPPDFSCLSLKDALALFCDKFSKQTGINCAFSAEENIDFSLISAEDQLHLFRMVQESFNNIEKHSKSNSASLVIRQNPGGVLLICISDEGTGIKTRGFTEGLGIRSIRQRAQIINAKIDFISESGNGLMVRIEMPPPPSVISDSSTG